MRLFRLFPVFMRFLCWHSKELFKVFYELFAPHHVYARNDY